MSRHPAPNTPIESGSSNGAGLGHRHRRRVLRGVAYALLAGIAVRLLTSMTIDGSLSKVLVTLRLESALVRLGAPDLGGRLIFNYTTSDVATQITDVATASLSFLAGLLVYQRYVFRWPRDTFTRCGACNHILCGLSRPRCPECGTPL